MKYKASAYHPAIGPMASVKQILGELKKDSYLTLLGKLIGETQYLQNNPPLVPEEDRIVKHVRDVLDPYSTSNGGPLVIKHIVYKKKRGNLIVEYPGTEPGKVVSFVGMHMDVVAANPGEWKVFPPFTLTIKGDQLGGRGTTDCLGHVALVTELLKRMAETKIKLKSSVIAVFIAGEENSSEQGVGVDQLAKDGWLDNLKGGPLYWVDTADSQPCIGTGGILPWRFKATGKLFHSGLPNKAINALELGMEALKVIQTNFYKDYPRHPKEIDYKFETPSTMKPTQWSYPGGGITQIPGECSINGDVRLTPFYSITDVKDKLTKYKDYLNANIETLDTRGPVSKYVLPDGTRGSINIEFDEYFSGYASDLNSRGYQVLYKATAEVIGQVKPYSITGSLPLIKDLQDEGYDVQAIGYGLTETYHANDEYCLLSDMSNGYLVFANIIAQLEE